MLCTASASEPTARMITTSKFFSAAKFSARAAMRLRVADVERGDRLGHEADLLLRAIDERELAFRTGDGERDAREAAARAHIDQTSRVAQMRRHATGCRACAA